jgi:hypothetical protein
LYNRIVKRHQIISIIIIVLVFAPVFAYASFATAAVSSFGGRVVSTKLPLVTCYGAGTGPLLLLSNLSSVGSAVYSSTGSGQPVATRTNNIVSGTFGAIPFYASSNSAVPRPGGWILGNAHIIPSFSTCDLQVGEYQIPFPVRTTSQYNVSR